VRSIPKIAEISTLLLSIYQLHAAVRNYGLLVSFIDLHNN